MNTLYLKLVRGTDRPDLIVADNNYYNLYWTSLRAIQRVASEDGNGRFGSLKGFKSLVYSGDTDVVLSTVASGLFD